MASHDPLQVRHHVLEAPPSPQTKTRNSSRTSCAEQDRVLRYISRPADGGVISLGSPLVVGWLFFLFVFLGFYRVVVCAWFFICSVACGYSLVFFYHENLARNKIATLNLLAGCSGLVSLGFRRLPRWSFSCFFQGYRFLSEFYLVFS